MEPYLRVFINPQHFPDLWSLLHVGLPLGSRKTSAVIVLVSLMTGPQFLERFSMQIEGLGDAQQ